MEEISINPTHHGTPILRILALLFLALLIAVISSLTTYYFLDKQGALQHQIYKSSNKLLQSQVASTEASLRLIPTPTLYPISSVWPKSDSNVIKRFTSDVLGITFLYPDKNKIELSTNMPDNVLVKGNRVYVYPTSIENKIEGAWFEVFYKNPSQSLEEAIKEKFLKGYSETDCFVKLDKTYISRSYPTSFTVAVISFPPATESTAPWWQNADKCPKDYTTTNGVSYFLMDKSYPSKLLYFSLGQQALLGQKPILPITDKGWMDTIQILK